jgi:hypothetical protein
MLKVVYKNEIWETELTLRDNLFPLLRESNPLKEITIIRDWQSKRVFIKDLQTPTEWRHS